MAFLVSALAHAAAVAWSAAVLPDRVPTHWGADLRPDAWGSRAGLVTAAALGGAALAALFTGLAALVRRIPLTYVNVPHTDHWTSAANVPALRTRLRSDVLWIGAATLLLLAGLTVLSTQAARSDGQRLPWTFVVLLLGYLVALAGRCGWMYRVRYRPD
nr:DUF1648 domain-containing protein [Motilibacter aurantiacus]